MILWIITHQFYDLLKLVGMRDRLRCPECKSMGTWKPHGGWLENSKESGRRWTCKWCGHYVGRPFNKGEIIVRKAFIDPELSCWRIIDFYPDGKTPDVAFVPLDLFKINPWFG